MKVTAQKLNNGIIFSKSKLIQSYQEYLKYYNQCCQVLYDKGYLSSPISFVPSDFMRNLQKSHSDVSMRLVQNCKLVNGVRGLSYEKVCCFLDTQEIKDKELFILLNIVRDTCLASESMETLLNLYNRVKFQKKTDTIKVLPRVSLSTSVLNDNFYLSQPCVWGAMEIPEGYSIYSLNFSHVLVRALARLCKVSEDVIKRHEDSGVSIFFENKGFDVDCRWIYSLLDNSIESTSFCSRILSDSIMKYYADSYKSKTKVQSLSFEKELFLDSTKEMIDETSMYRGEIYSLGGREFCITDTDILYIMPDSYSGELCYLKKVDMHPFNTSRFVGSCVLDNVSGVELSKRNCLKGFTGEFISEDVVNDRGYYAKGFPILLESALGKLYNYYPIYNVFLDKDAERLAVSPLLCNALDFTYSDIKDVCYRLHLGSLDSMIEVLRDRVLSLHSGTGVSLAYATEVGELVSALVRIECNVALRGHTCANEIGVVPSREAILEAEEIFKSFNF